MAGPTPDSPQYLVSLTKALNIGRLSSGEGEVFEVNFHDLPQDEDIPAYSQGEALPHINTSAIGISDDDQHLDGEPFEILAGRMTNLLEDGSIKKRVLREGYGDPIPDKALVTIHYNAYIEYNEDPFDSTYIRKKPFKFTVNNGETIVGLDIATQSMKLNELSQFLVKSNYAFGPMGCLQRVPPNATILYEIEVTNVLDTAYAAQLNEEPQSFTQVRRQALAWCLKAKEHFTRGATNQAIRLYNTAVEKLQTVTLRDLADQEKQEELLLRLYTNLAVSYTKINEPRRACTNCNRVYHLCKGTSLKVPAKVYFHHGRCLIQLGDYAMAERKLREARKIEPNNTEISKELETLDRKRTESRARELEMAQAMCQFATNRSPDSEFKKLMTRYCQDLLADVNTIQYSLPDDLSPQEIVFCKKEAKAHQLEFKSTTQDNKTSYYIFKSESNDDYS